MFESNFNGSKNIVYVHIMLFDSVLSCKPELASQIDRKAFF